MSAVVPPGEYTGQQLADAIEGRIYSDWINKTGRTFGAGSGFAFSHNNTTGKFGLGFTTLSPPFYDGVEDYEVISVPDSNGKFMLGLRTDIEQTHYAPESGQMLGIISEGVVKNNRFIVSYRGTTAALHLTDVNFTAATLLGFSTGADKTGLGVTCSDTDYVGIEAQFSLTSDYLRVDLADPDFFGTEGGLEGRLDTYLGKTDQAASAYLATQWGVTVPAFRGVCHAVAYRVGSPTGMYVGDTNYPKPPAWVVERMPNGLGVPDGKHNIKGDANPACIIYDALTDQRWGLGMPSAQIDTAAFLSAAETLASEGFGLSPLYETVDDAWEFVMGVLKQIDGFVGTDHVTGLVTIKLVRGDYDMSLVPVVNDDNTIAIKLTRGAYDQTTNVVKVKYVDRAKNFTERMVQEIALDNIQARNGDQAVEELTMNGVSSEENATVAAKRAIRVLASAAATIEITMNREHWNVRPGQPFRLDSIELNVTGMPCRATNVRSGEINASEIVIDAVQDVTGVAWPDNGGDLSGWGIIYGFDWGGIP